MFSPEDLYTDTASWKNTSYKHAFDDQLRITQGVEVAILLHEIGDQEYKVSLRSNNYIDVSKIASFFGGGGHVKAAGFTMRGSAHDVVNNITGHIESQMFNK